MRFFSVCSGIEAASVAWEPLGWEAVGFSEIEPFPAAVLKHRYPNIINYGDMTKHEQWNIPSGTIDLLAGGTPCQSFSVAGLRQGLHDPRGGLMLTFLEIAQRLRPRWIVWENVPGVLSSNGGRDFGSFLGALGELGFGWAYRILDAQWCGLAQRRRRVFVVGCLGDRDAAAKVLFERESVCRDTPPRRETGQGTAADAEECAGGGGSWWDGRQTSQTLDAVLYKRQTMPEKNRFPAVLQPVVTDRAASHWEGSGVHPTLNQSFNTGAIGYSDQEIFSQGGAGLVQAIPIHDQATRNAGKRGDRQDGKGNGLGVGKPGDPAPTLTKGDKHAVLFQKSELVQESIPMNIYGGNKRKDRPAGGFYVEENPQAAKALDAANGLNPTCSQGGVAVAVPLVQAVDVYNQTIDGDVAATLTKAVGGTNTSGAKVMAFKPGDPEPTLRKDMGDNQMAVAMRESGQGYWMEDNKAGTLRAEGENRPSRPSNVIAQAVAVDLYNQTIHPETSQTIRSKANDVEHTGAVMVAFTTKLHNTKSNNAGKIFEERTTCLDAASPPPALLSAMAVRRLTPRECERLQGFPDDWTLIPWRGKPADQCPDGPRYKALGNSMAVPCMAWIGKRIAEAAKA